MKLASTHPLSFPGSERSEENREPIITDRGYGFRALLALLAAPE